MDRTVEDLESSVDRLLGRFSRIQSERDQIASEKDALEQKVKELEVRLVSCQENLTRLESERGRLEKRRSDCVVALDTLIGKLDGAEQVRTDAASGAELLPPVSSPAHQEEPSEESSRFEQSVTRLRSVAVDRERVRGGAAAAGKRIF